MTDSPRRRIRQYCLDCCLGSAAEVSLCVSTTCILHPYRSGHRAPGQDLGPLKAIRKHCLSCGEPGSAASVRNCPIKTCALHPYRFGHDPKRKGQGNRAAKMPGKPNFAELNEGFERADALGGIK